MWKGSHACVTLCRELKLSRCEALTDVALERLAVYRGGGEPDPDAGVYSLLSDDDDSDGVAQHFAGLTVDEAKPGQVCRHRFSFAGTCP